MWKAARESLDFSHFYLVVLHPSFMPKPCVKKELTSSEHDPIRSKFIEESYFFGPSNWPSSVSNQFSHHERKPKRKKEDLSKSLIFHFILCFCEQAFPSSIFSHHPFVLLLLYLIPVNYFLSNPFLRHSLFSSFKSAKYLCFLLPASLGLFLRGKA